MFSAVIHTSPVLRRRGTSSTGSADTQVSHLVSQPSLPLLSPPAPWHNSRTRSPRN
ncbi:hypothetical protein M404DRAFT_991850 [Pisolithus tinctorius Marx 270]|uniref:Uncharacterized protein n=1 Tax=Pisolithus tinctorius Marx 270 TaxID=870435 RepID=A0A0C3K155_PISTI|nr:hypothetical protein M404DRAFT_991850 [Pisolithus tinctorius Marx 270]